MTFSLKNKQMGGEIIVIGHKKQLDRLKKAYRTGGIANAYLFSGPKGIGKAHMIKYFFASVFCDKGSACGTCPNCQQLMAGVHPDCHSIGGMDGVIKIDEVRQLQRKLSQTSVSKIRFVLIEDCENLTDEAANALLKILEEPPPLTSLFLTTSQPIEILPTIRSRCRIVSMQDVAVSGLKSGLIQKGFTPEDIRILQSKLPYLRPGEFIRCLEDNDYREQKLRAHKDIERLLEREGVAEGLLICEDYTVSSGLASEFLHCLLQVSQWRLRSINDNETAARLAALAKRADKGLKELGSNVNRRLLLDNIVLFLYKDLSRVA